MIILIDFVRFCVFTLNIAVFIDGISYINYPSFGNSHHCAITSKYATENRTIMSWIGDKAEDAVENKIFEEGGYPAWIKYKAWKAYESCAECCK